MSHHRTVHTDAAPAALGPYSQAVSLEVGERRLLFLSGQVPIDPETGEMVEGPVEEQVGQVMRNLEAVLTAAGSDFGKVVQTTIFLADMDDFATVNEVYGSWFEEDPPCRATVQVARLPKDARVEIAMTAYA